MSASQPTYRAIRFSRKGDLPKSYRCTYQMIDEFTQQIMAEGDVNGYATFSVVHHGSEPPDVEMRPNRKIMPSRWIVMDPPNPSPCNSTGISCENWQIQYTEAFSLYSIPKTMRSTVVVDTRQNVPDRILGVGPDEWAIMDGEELVARVALLPKQRKTSVDLLGKVRDFFASSNRGIVSVTGDHALAAPIALGTLLIINELTASRSGGSN